MRDEDDEAWWDSPSYRDLREEREQWWAKWQEMSERAEQWHGMYQEMKKERADCEAEVEEMEGALKEEESRCFWQTEVMAVELEAVERELGGLYYDQKVRRWEEEQEGVSVKKQGKKKKKK